MKCTTNAHGIYLVFYFLTDFNVGVVKAVFPWISVRAFPMYCPILVKISLRCLRILFSVVKQSCGICS